jgi:hypothetical protein
LAPKKEKIKIKNVTLLKAGQWTLTVYDFGFEYQTWTALFVQVNADLDPDPGF